MFMEEVQTPTKDYIVHFKVGTIAVVGTVIFSSLIGVGIAYEKIQSKIRHIDGKTTLYQTQFDDLEHRVDSNDILFAEIKKDLSSIEAILLDIKSRDY